MCFSIFIISKSRKVHINPKGPSKYVLNPPQPEQSMGRVIAFIAIVQRWEEKAFSHPLICLQDSRLGDVLYYNRRALGHLQ